VSYGDDFVEAQRALANEYGFPCYEDALRSWIATVATVEAGYVGEWEEYVHELMARDYLGQVTSLSPTSKARVDEDLNLWDERFRAATVEEREPHLPSDEGAIGWWQYRSPKRWRQPATEELARRGLLPES
jgi:hypothetical protein